MPTTRAGEGGGGAEERESLGARLHKYMTTLGLRFLEYKHNGSLRTREIP